MWLIVLLLLLFVLGVAGGVVWHPWVFLVCVVAVGLFVADRRGGRL